MPLDLVESTASPLYYHEMKPKVVVTVTFTIKATEAKGPRPPIVDYEIMRQTVMWLLFGFSPFIKGKGQKAQKAFR